MRRVPRKAYLVCMKDEEQGNFFTAMALLLSVWSKPAPVKAQWVV